MQRGELDVRSDGRKEHAHGALQSTCARDGQGEGAPDVFEGRGVSAALELAGAAAAQKPTAATRVEKGKEKQEEEGKEMEKEGEKEKGKGEGERQDGMEESG